MTDSLTIKTLPNGDGLVAYGSTGWVVDAQGHVGPEFTPPASELSPEPTVLGNGNVLVVDGGASLRRALVGGQLGLLAQDNGWAGIIVRNRSRNFEGVRFRPSVRSVFNGGDRWR